MHRTGKYKLINLIFGVCPFIGITLIILMREDSGPLQMWLSIVSDTLYSRNDIWVFNSVSDPSRLWQRRGSADHAQYVEMLTISRD